MAYDTAILHTPGACGVRTFVQGRPEPGCFLPDDGQMMLAPVYFLFLGPVNDLVIVSTRNTVESMLPALETRLAFIFEQVALNSTPDCFPYALGFMRSQLVAAARLPVLVGYGHESVFGQPILAMEVPEQPGALGTFRHGAGFLPGRALAHALEIVQRCTQRDCPALYAAQRYRATSRDRAHS